MATAVDPAGAPETPPETPKGKPQGAPTTEDRAFERFAGTRPRIRRDVLYTETPGGVLFHNADGGFHLTGRTAYRFASLLVPHLSGEHRLDELCRGLRAPQRAMAAELVRTLYERGFARDVPLPDGADHGPRPEPAVAERFAAQIAYLDHYADQPAERFQRFRATRVAVLGGDPVADWCVLSLVRNGVAHVGVAADEASGLARADAEARELTEDNCPVRIERWEPAAAHGGPDGPGWAELAGYDVVVVSGPHAARRTHRLLADGVPEGSILVPAWTFGRRVVVGPLSTATSTGCWSCALLRLGGNLDPGTAAELWSEVATPAVPGGSGADGAGDRLDPPGPVAGPVAAMVGNLLGYEVFRLTTGALPAETRGQALFQDLESLDVIAEPVHPHPHCRLCRPVAAEASAPHPATAAPALPDGLAVPTTPTVETARAAEELVEELGRISAALVRPHTGVLTRYDDEHLTQTPLKVSTVELAVGQGVRRRITAFDVHHLAGARLRALRAAAGAYVDHVVPPTAVVDGSGPAAELPRRGPETLVTGSGVPEDGSARDAWTVATSLLTKEPVLVPVAAVRPFGPYNRDRAQAASGAGVGAGGALAEAVGLGLLSALAHQALLRAVRGRARVRRYLLDDLDDFDDSDDPGDPGDPGDLGDPGDPGGLGDVDGPDAPEGPDAPDGLRDVGDPGDRSVAPSTLGEENREAADPELVFLRRTAHHLGIGVELLDLGEPSHSSAHAVLARETDPEGPGRWAVACDLTAEAAACAALRDLLGQAQFTAETGEVADLGDGPLTDLAPAAVAVTDPPVTVATVPPTDWDTVLDHLRAAGQDVLVVPTTPADLAAGGLATARVLLTVEGVADERA